MSYPTDAPVLPAERVGSELLIPLLYEELRRLAAVLSSRLRPGQTLQPTALVHEAFLRLECNRDSGWEGRRHFYGAAARAMRQVLVDSALAKRTSKRGGDRQRLPLAEAATIASPDGPPVEDLLSLDEALSQLESEDPIKARLVELRYFAGLSVEEAACALGVSKATAKRYWAFSKAWLYGRLKNS